MRPIHAPRRNFGLACALLSALLAGGAGAAPAASPSTAVTTQSAAPAPAPAASAPASPSTSAPVSPSPAAQSPAIHPIKLSDTDKSPGPIAPAATALPGPPGSPPPQPAPKVEKPPKPGPGASDAGKRANTLRTEKVLLLSLIDRSVVSREKREIGHVVDVLIDTKGAPAALVVDVGGFMGMGNRKIAIGWERFTLAGLKPNDALQVPFSEAQIKSAPALSGSQEVTVVQQAIEPDPSLAASRVDLGEDLGPLSNTAQPPTNPLNPD